MLLIFSWQRFWTNFPVQRGLHLNINLFVWFLMFKITNPASLHFVDTFCSWSYSHISLSLLSLFLLLDPFLFVIVILFYSWYSSSSSDRLPPVYLLSFRFSLIMIPISRNLSMLLPPPSVKGKNIDIFLCHFHICFEQWRPKSILSIRFHKSNPFLA